ncbi:hypothetical protein, partial [uncultured Bacteroides sp.]|uniref:hypothetical protein n=1 Tax=uncultured Bacteroides sp. TaxID=162156 RepID=UPI0025997851
IHACHAWGHGFESRTHRKIKLKQSSGIQEFQSFLVFCIGKNNDLKNMRGIIRRIPASLTILI